MLRESEVFVYYFDVLILLCCLKCKFVVVITFVNDYGKSVI